MEFHFSWHLQFKILQTQELQTQSQLKLDSKLLSRRRFGVAFVCMLIVMIVCYFTNVNR